MEFERIKLKNKNGWKYFHL